MSKLSFSDVRLNYDPSAPQQRFRDAGLEAAFASPSAQLPSTPPWPSGAIPQPMPLSPPPAETDDLSRFHDYDAVVVTWTAAEAAALAALFTPGHLISSWYEYRHGIETYVPLVTGAKSPFNDSSAEMARYFHSLGLYFPCQIGSAKVLLFKSGLHLAYDGPATPVKKLMAEIAQAVNPKLFITTGTAGAIGADVLLGDVVVGASVRFDCTTQFKNEPWHDSAFTPSPLAPETLAAISPALLQINSSRVPNSRPTPKIWHAATDAIVTTDTFAFDDSTDHYKLQGLGRVCEMGDAMVASALQGIPGLAWHAIRNASDPQIPNPSNNIEKADQEAAQIYAKYGGLTTAASVIVTWAVIHAGIALHAGASSDANSTQKSSGFKLGRLSPVRDSHGVTTDVEPSIASKEKRK
jgi:nucleoside phosphorylase